MTKVQLSLTSQEAAILSSYGAKFGYNLPKTIRFVISKASEQFLESGIIPVYEMSDKTEKKGDEALKEYSKGQGTELKSEEDIKTFFNSL